MQSGLSNGSFPDEASIGYMNSGKGFTGFKSGFLPKTNERNPAMTADS
jgi:hypothetical protein